MPSCLFAYSVDASCSHAAVMCWIVPDSFFCTAHRCLAASRYISCSFFLVWLGPVLRLETLCFGEQFRACQPFFQRFMSTCCWLRWWWCRPCKAFWDHCLLALLLYSSSVASLFSFAWSKSSGVCLSSAFTIAACRGDEACLFKKYEGVFFPEYEGVSPVYRSAE